MFRPLLLSVGLSLLSFGVSAHQGHTHDSAAVSAAPLAINGAWIREWVPGSASTAAYFTLDNQNHHSAQLVKATIDGVARVEIHEHRHVDGMMKMQQVTSVDVAANSQESFEPGGLHLMLFEPSVQIKKGTSLKLTLYFADGNRVYTMADVKRDLEQDDSHQHHH